MTKGRAGVLARSNDRMQLRNFYFCKYPSNVIQRSSWFW